MKSSETARVIRHDGGMKTARAFMNAHPGRLLVIAAVVLGLLTVVLIITTTQNTPAGAFVKTGSIILGGLLVLAAEFCNVLSRADQVDSDAKESLADWSAICGMFAAVVAAPAVVWTLLER